MQVRGSHRNKEVIGWVTTKLLKPHPGPNKPAEPLQQQNTPALLTIEETSSSSSSSSSSKKEKSNSKAQQQTTPLPPLPPPTPDSSSALYEQNNNNNNNNDDFDCGDGPVHKVMEKLTNFMAQTTYLIKECCEEDLLFLVSLHTASPVSMEEAEGIIDGGVWRQVEAEVCFFIYLLPHMLPI
jgi:DNA mismatch repair ATPase MutL